MFISLAINPTTYIVIFLLLGVVLKSKRWKRLCLTLSALLFLLFSNGALYQWIAEQWYKETIYIRHRAGRLQLLGLETKPTRI